MSLPERKYVILDKLEREALGLEKLLITLATGTIVVSVTFLNMVASAPVMTDWLIASWVSLASSIVFGLADRILYVHGLAEHPHVTLTESDDERLYQERRWLGFMSLAEKISWLQIVSFISGIGLLLGFAITNID